MLFWKSRIFRKSGMSDRYIFKPLALSILLIYLHTRARNICLGSHIHWFIPLPHVHRHWEKPPSSHLTLTRSPWWEWNQVNGTSAYDLHDKAFHNYRNITKEITFQRPKQTHADTKLLCFSPWQENVSSTQ